MVTQIFIPYQYRSSDLWMNFFNFQSVLLLFVLCFQDITNWNWIDDILYISLSLDNVTKCAFFGGISYKFLDLSKKMYSRAAYFAPIPSGSINGRFANAQLDSTVCDWEWHQHKSNVPHDFLKKLGIAFGVCDNASGCLRAYVCSPIPIMQKKMNYCQRRRLPHPCY